MSILFIRGKFDIWQINPQFSLKIPISTTYFSLDLAEKWKNAVKLPLTAGKSYDKIAM